MSYSLFRLRRTRRGRITPSRTRPLQAEALEPRHLMSAGSLLEPLGVPTLGAATALGDNADTAVQNRYYSYKNFGNYASMAVGKDTARGDECQSFLRFNLSGTTGSVDSAVLNLTALRWSSTSPNALLRLRLVSDAADAWVEGTGGYNYRTSGAITWYNRPLASGSAITIAASQWPASGALSIDVTSLVNQSFNANRIATFQLDVVAPSGSNAWIYLATRENATSSYRPSLMVNAGGQTNQAPTVAVAAAASGPVAGTSTALSVLGADDGGQSNLKYTWTATTLPSGAAAPIFSVNGTNTAKNTTVTFSKAGTYVLTATIADTAGLSVTSNVTVVVNQTLTSLNVTPGSVSLSPGATQAFAAAGLDQFGNPVAAAPSLTWTTTAGTITANGLLTAPGTAGSLVVTASSGAVRGTANVTVSTASFLGLQDAALASLTQSLFVDGSISRQDMIQILRSVGSDDRVVDNVEIVDLRTILSNSATLRIAGYVRVLAGDVVNGNVANAQFQGQTLGNLRAGSTATQLNKLVDKWFLGADHPGAPGFTYRSAAGSLFVGGPSHGDMFQGQLGDCYLIAALGSIADQSASAIQNMFLDNGDNTWTVRFYANGVADYVTVDRWLPTNSYGRLVYADYGRSATDATNELWIPLVEKAYAQWNETGKEGRDGLNLYSSIEGGWMADVYAQVLGKNAGSYSMASTNRTVLVNAMTSKWAVTIGTKDADTLSYGLVGCHAYAVIGYNSIAGTFTLYNPWGSNQPTRALTWAQLQSVADAFSVVNASGTVPLSQTKAQPAALWALDQAFTAHPEHAATPSSLAWASNTRARSTTGSTADSYAVAVDMLLEQVA